MRLLYYCPASYGGIADYAHEQANALATLGVEVTLLCTPSYPTDRVARYRLLPLLRDLAPAHPSLLKVKKAWDFVGVTLQNFACLARVIQSQKFQSVLLASYVEYLAPLWSGQLQRLARKGVVFGAVVHDPVRDFVLGPGWWHRWSVACGYSFLREAFVHEAIALDTAKPMPQLRTTVIPYGVHQFPAATRSPFEMRQALNLPLEAKVMLAFGHIRDGKNLDLVIQALAQFPEVYLVVAGKEQSASQRPVAFYQEVAATWGVSDRCRWQIEFIPETEIGNLFNAVDLVLLTYSKQFRSASSVLSTATSYRKPCLASSGDGSLRSLIQQYELGIWVEPDDVSAIADGIKQWLSAPPQPQWSSYFAENSWTANAKQVINALVDL